jgi:putative hydrolase of HD superfamily
VRNIVNFLFEVGILKKVPRSGYQFLGTGSESVADHSFRVAVIAYLLAKREPEADVQKAVLMSLFHDLPEARTGDHNYVNKMYVTANEDKAVNDLAHQISFGPEISDLIREFNSRQSLEARLVYEADQLDFILELKRQQDLGNRSAAEWLSYSVKRLSSNFAKKLAEEILQTDSSEWWFRKKEELWVDG